MFDTYLHTVVLLEFLSRFCVLCWSFAGFRLSRELILMLSCAIPDSNVDLGIRKCTGWFHSDDFPCSFAIIRKEVGII